MHGSCCVALTMASAPHQRAPAHTPMLGAVPVAILVPTGTGNGALRLEARPAGREAEEQEGVAVVLDAPSSRADVVLNLGCVFCWPCCLTRPEELDRVRRSCACD